MLIVLPERACVVAVVLGFILGAVLMRMTR